MPLAARRAAGNTGFGGATGLFRLFGTSFGTEISWLIPAALIGLVAGLWFTRRFPRTDRIRAGLVLWGGSMIVTALVFSFMSGTIHPYYAVALAPSIAAVVAISGNELWRGRNNTVVRAILALMIAATGIWSFVLLGRDTSWLPWLRWVVLIGSIAGAALLVASVARLAPAGRHRAADRLDHRAGRHRRLHGRDCRNPALRVDPDVRADRLGDRRRGAVRRAGRTGGGADGTRGARPDGTTADGSGTRRGRRRQHHAGRHGPGRQRHRPAGTGAAPRAASAAAER